MKQLIALAGLALCVTHAAAQVHVGATVGRSKVDLGCEGLSDCTNKDTGFKLFANYDVSAPVGVEVAYIDFGKVDVSVPASVSGFSSDVKGQLEAQALMLAAVVRAEFTPQFGAAMRIGVAHVTSKASVTTGEGSGSVEEKAFKPYLGLGLEYAVTKKIKAVGGLDFMQAQLNGGSEDIYLWSVGAQYDF